MNVKKYVFKADFPSWPASMETWGAVYNIRNDRDPPLLARFPDHKTKPATFRKFVGQCLNCLSGDGHNMRTCSKPFLNKSGLMNNKIGELPEPEKEAVWRRIQNRFKNNLSTGHQVIPPEILRGVDETRTGRKLRLQQTKQRNL